MNSPLFSTIGRDTAATPFRKLVRAFALAFLLVIPLIGALFVLVRQPQIAQETRENLTAIARMNGSQVEHWLRERQDDVTMMAQNPTLDKLVRDFRARQDTATRDALADHLQALRSTHHVEAVSLYSTDGEPLFEDGPAIDTAKLRGRLGESDLRPPVAYDLVGAGNTPPRLLFAAPLPAGEASSAGIVVTTITLDKSLAAITRRWPTPSPSGEIVIARREGTAIEFVATPRMGGGNASTPTQTDETTLHAAQSDAEGTFEGRDYRNQPVIAAYRPVAGTGWRIIAKVDRDEVMAPMWITVGGLAAVALIADLLIIAAMMVTWRRQETTHQQQENEERLRNDRLQNSLFNLPFVAMAIIDPETRRFLRVNAHSLTLTGYSEEELLKKPPRELAHPDDYETASRDVSRILSGEIDAARVELRVIRKDGTALFAEIEFRCLRDANGSIEALVGTARDTTPQVMHAMAIHIANVQLKNSQNELRQQNEALQEAKTALEESHARYISLYELAPVAYLTLASDGAILKCNRKGLELLAFNLDAETPNWPNFVQFIDADDLEHWNEFLRRTTASSDRQNDEFMLRTAHGVRLFVSIEASFQIMENGFSLIRMTLNDVTARKMSEQALRVLSEVVSQSPEVIIITDPEGNIEYVNRAFVDRSGYSQSEAIGNKPRMLRSGKTPPRTYEEMWETLMRGGSWKGEFINQRKDGSIYTEFAIIHSIRNTDGRIEHFVAIKEDITEKKRLAEELESYRSHLEDLVAERTRELEAVRAQAELASAAKSAFLANMSHEIRTPMNAIVGMTHLLRNSDASPRQLDRLDKINNAAVHLLELINNILDLSKIEAGKMALEEVDFALNALFDEVRTMIANQARTKRLPVVIDLEGVPLWLRGDASRLRQALLNYAVNAVKFTERGIISLRALLIEENAEGCLVRFEVEDTGIGIAAAKIPNLFSAFEQADTSITRKYGGTGLGLAITARLAHLMGGEVGVHSALGQGSTFWLTARFKHGEGMMPHVESVTPGQLERELRRNYAGLRVLLADDVEVNLEVAQLLLHGVGLEVEIARNGREAVDKTRITPYALILMDVQMPEMNGLEATRVIRQMSLRRHTPILAMTANAFEDDRHRCLEAGMNDFVAKPVNPETLYAMLIKWLPRTFVGEAAVPDVETPEPAALPSPPQTFLERLADVPGLDLASALARVRGNQEKLTQVISLFLSSHETDYERIAAALGSNDLTSAEQLAHALKGSASLIGATQVAESAAALLVAIRLKAGENEILEAAAALKDRLQGLIAALRVARSPEAQESSPVVAVDIDRARKVLAHLEQLLEEGDMDTCTVAREQGHLIRSAFGDPGRELLTAIDIFDFDGALGILRRIAAT